MQQPSVARLASLAAALVSLAACSDAIDASAGGDVAHVRPGATSAGPATDGGDGRDGG